MSLFLFVSLFFFLPILAKITRQTRLYLKCIENCMHARHQLNLCSNMYLIGTRQHRTFTFGEKCDCSEANKSENNTVSPLKNGMFAVAAVAAVAVVALMLDGIVNNFDCLNDKNIFTFSNCAYMCSVGNCHLARHTRRFDMLTKKKACHAVAYISGRDDPNCATFG